MSNQAARRVGLVVVQWRVLRWRRTTLVAYSRNRLGVVDPFAKREQHAPFVAVVENVRHPSSDLEPEFVDQHIRGLAVGVRGAGDDALGGRVAPELAVEPERVEVIVPLEGLLDSVV